MQQTNAVQTLMHLLKANVGTGILAMPAAFLASGLLVGTVGIPILCVICTICIHQLIRANDHLCKKLGITKAMDYEEVAEQSCLVGPHWFRRYSRHFKNIVTLFLLLTQFGISCAYCIFVAANLREIAIDWKLFENADMSVKFYMLIIWPITVLANFVKSIKHLSIFSACANILQLTGLLIICYDLFKGIQPLSSRPAVGNSIPVYFSIAVFAFEGIAVCLPIYIPMKKPQQFTSTFGVLNVGMAIVAFCYFSIGFLGYLKYGVEVKGSITLNLPNEVLYQMVRLIFSIAIFLTHPLALYVPITLFWPKAKQLVERCFSDKDEKTLNIAEYIFRTFMVSMTFVIAASIPKVELMISLVGAVASSSVAIIFPPILEMLTFWEEKTGSSKKFMILKNGIIVFFGVLGALLGTYYSVEAIVEAFREGQFT